MGLRRRDARQPGHRSLARLRCRLVTPTYPDREGSRRGGLRREAPHVGYASIVAAKELASCLRDRFPAPHLWPARASTRIALKSELGVTERDIPRFGTE